MKKLFLVLITIIIVVFSSCANTGISDQKNLLVGTWTQTIDNEVIEYTFNNDNTGKLTSSLGIEAEFKYTILDENQTKIEIETEQNGEKKKFEYEYTIKDNTLTLDGSEYSKNK